MTMHDPDSMAGMIEACFSAWSVDAAVAAYSVGPRFTLFSLDIKLGQKLSRVHALLPELARALSVHHIELVEHLPASPGPALLVMNRSLQQVTLASVLQSQAFIESTSPTTLMIGMDVAGQPIAVDLSLMPHILIAGTANAGKSVLMHAMIVSLLYKSVPAEVRLILVDTNQLEFALYQDIPHLLTPIITDPVKAVSALHWATRELKRRQSEFKSLGVNRLDLYNQRVSEMNREQDLCTLPQIVIMIDDYADILRGDGDAGHLLGELSQRGHPAGIHLILTTRNPLADVITSSIKTHFPARIALSVTTKSASRQILDREGAEFLLGEGDMLFMHSSLMMPLRIQGTLARDEEIHHVVNEWALRARPYYLDGVTDEAWPSETSQPEYDPLLDAAVEFVVAKRSVSVTALQREFRIGSNRAARIIEQLESQGTVSPADGSGNRQVNY